MFIVTLVDYISVVTISGYYSWSCFSCPLDNYVTWMYLILGVNYKEGIVCLG